MSFGGARIAGLRQHDRHRLAGDQLRLVQRLRRFALDDLRATIVAIGFGVLKNLFLDQRLQSRRALQRFLQPVSLFLELVLLAADLHFLEFGQISQAQIENRFGLDIAELEALHQHRLRLVFFANDRDHFVDIQVGDQQAVEDVQSIIDDLQAVARGAF